MLFGLPVRGKDPLTGSWLKNEQFLARDRLLEGDRSVAPGSRRGRRGDAEARAGPVGGASRRGRPQPIGAAPKPPRITPSSLIRGKAAAWRCVRPGFPVINHASA